VSDLYGWITSMSFALDTVSILLDNPLVVCFRRPRSAMCYGFPPVCQRFTGGDEPLRRSEKSRGARLAAGFQRGRAFLAIYCPLALGLLCRKLIVYITLPRRRSA
jgi:hypothetical protein